MEEQIEHWGTEVFDLRRKNLFSKEGNRPKEDRKNRGGTKSW